MSWFARIFGKSRPSADAAAAAPAQVERRRKPGTGGSPGNKEPLRRQSDRAIRRDLLHTVVREAMLDLGVLSSHFKFKIISLDHQGLQFLVMVDLSEEVSHDLTDLASMESVIIQRALSHRKLQIKSVYWRMTEAAQVLPPSLRGKAHHPGGHGDTGVHAGTTASGFPITELPPGQPHPPPIGTTQYGDLR